VSLNALNLRRIDFEYSTTAYMAHRIRRFATKRQLIEEIDAQPAPPPPCPKGKIRLNVRAQPPQPATQQHQLASRQGIIQAFPGTSPIVRALTGQPSTAQGVILIILFVQSQN
jgi:E1A-binding protein p400